jgi:phosphoglycolate phosphatase-like HAD superfamily hydrolase
VLPTLTLLLLAVAAFAQSADPLPSWNDGPAKKAITEFVSKTTTPGGPDFVPVPERIATFDNDGTLWSEQPIYFQFVFALDRVRALAPKHPEWKGKQPFKGILEGDMKAVMAAGEKGLLEVLAVTHTGMTTDEFHQIVRDWLAQARHPRFQRPYTDLVYQPMLELLAYLRANGFKTFIVSGGGVEFMRAFAERVYGIPPEQVVGSTGEAKFELRNGKPVLVKLPKVNHVDDGPGKPVGINRVIGRRPILAFGNSDGDHQMLQWTAAGSGGPLRGPGPPHRCRPRVGVRPTIPHRPARQGARRGAVPRLDGRRHEGRLEADLPVRVTEAGTSHHPAEYDGAIVEETKAEHRPHPFGRLRLRGRGRVWRRRESRHADAQSRPDGYLKHPPRALQSEGYPGPVTLTQYQRFQHLREQLAKEGFNIGLPTGN